jgi:hypothetical protein
MSGRLAQSLPRLRKIIAQFSFMTFGSGLFFLIKIGCLYLAGQLGVAAWLSYLVITVALTIVGWTYHSKVTFKTELSVHTAWRLSHSTVALMLADYLGFLALTYTGRIYPVISAVIMSGILFGVRYLSYSLYVFRERESKADLRSTFSHVILGIALLVGSINYALAIDDAEPKKDGKQNYCAAANLYVSGVLSNDCDDVEGASGVAPQPSMKREPGTPALVALTFALADGDRDVRACVATSPEWCKTLRTHQRMLLLLPFLAFILLVYVAGYDITANANLAAAAALCAAFGTGLIEGSMAFLTEPPAAVLLLLVAWMLYRLACLRRLMLSTLVCGIALGMLALTKAVYFYLVPVLGLLALLALAFRSRRGAAAGTLVAVVIAALISGLWIYRNQERFGSNSVAGRAGSVMSTRATLTTMTWPQYWSGYLAFTPKLGPKLIDLLGIDPANVAVFDRSSPESLEENHHRDEVVGSGSRQGALGALVEHWPMELALIPLTVYRSAFLPVGSNSHHGRHGSWPMRAVRLLSLALATAIAMGMMPAFFLNFSVDLWRLNRARLAFHLPALYTVGVHSVLTHYIPRYNLPLFGVFAIELCLALALLWSLTGTDVRAHRPLLDKR